MWSDVASSITSVSHSNSPSPSSAPTYSEFTTNSSGYTTNESDDDDLADNAATSNDVNLATFTTHKLVGDNYDKNVSPREMRYDHQIQSHHYFQTYAVRDHVDLSAFSNEVKHPDLHAIQLDNLLPTSTDEIQD